MRNVITTGLISLALIFAHQQEAIAVEPLSAIELTVHCMQPRAAPERIDGIFCKRCVSTMPCAKE